MTVTEVLCDTTHTKDSSSALCHLLAEAAGGTYSSQISGGRRARPLGSPPGAWGTRRGWSACKTKHRGCSGTGLALLTKASRCSPASGSLGRRSPAVERTAGHTSGSLLHGVNLTLLTEFIFTHSVQWENPPEPRTPVCLRAVNRAPGAGGHLRDHAGKQRERASGASREQASSSWCSGRS